MEIQKLTRDVNGNGRWLIKGISAEAAQVLGARKSSQKMGGFIVQASHTDSGRDALITDIHNAMRKTAHAFEEVHDADYRAYTRKKDAVEQSSLSDRRAGAEDYKDLLTDLDTLQERTRWAVGGDYGQMSYTMIRRQLRANRKNAPYLATIGQVLALFESNCTAVYARKVWNSLTSDQQEAANRAMHQGIIEALTE